jgi:hypothetical protein
VPGYLCLDDTFIPHERSKKMEGVYWDWDHALRRNVLGTRRGGAHLDGRVPEDTRRRGT